MAVKRCRSCGYPVIAEHRYGEPMTVDACSMCDDLDAEAETAAILDDPDTMAALAEAEAELEGDAAP